MRASSAAALSLIAAILGGAVVLVLGKGAGWLGGDTTTIVHSRLTDAGVPNAVVAARPLAGNGFQPAQIYRARAAGVVTIVSDFDANGASAGQGSGFVVSRKGVVLTAAHVITTAGQGAVGNATAAHAVWVQFADGDRVPARIVGFDLYDDVGVLRVDPAQHALHPVPLGRSASVVVGAPVAAIGSPFGNADSLSVGVVSATGRSIPSLTTHYDLVDAIQTDAPINHGNSGGPLFDARGRVIGINAQIRSSGTSSGFEGVGFAVPIDSARRSLEQLLATGHVAYGYVGISTEDITPSVGRRFHLGVTQGALVSVVRSGSPAARAGLRAGTRDVAFEGLDVRVGGDAIVAIDGAPVRSAADVVRLVSGRLLPGQVARFTVVRDGRRLTLPVTLATRTGSG
ncbi:MAG TPA: trypsin-like peptidase domain-containing protein [Gaiellaceae bacterium]